MKDVRALVRPLLERLPALLLLGLLTTACVGGASTEAPPTSTVIPAPTSAPPTPRLTGYSFPILGACLPKGDQLIPGAPRTYRNGFHEGLDLYDSDNCVPIGRNTPVVAVRQGRVVRADVKYEELSAAELAQLNSQPGTEQALDRFRGRQVWLDHGDGVITRYAHLASIAPGVQEGVTVLEGQVIAFVGESGTPESVTAPGTENHLHFEVRIGSSFLGEGQSRAEARRSYEMLFKR